MAVTIFWHSAKIPLHFNTLLRLPLFKIIQEISDGLFSRQFIGSGVRLKVLDIRDVNQSGVKSLVRDQHVFTPTSKPFGDRVMQNKPGKGWK
jgi:hypothetical protein